MVVAGFWLIRMYSLGFFLDKKKDTLKIVLRFSRKGTRERALSGVESIDVRLNGNIGMTFIINYKPNYKEEVEYRFYRLALLEKIQHKRTNAQTHQRTIRQGQHGDSKWGSLTDGPIYH